MITSPYSALDQAELLQLALTASSNNDSGMAIAYLKEATSRPDTTGKAHFILGAEYAQIKLYDRALIEMEAAIALDPTLLIARFQLGLLWLSSGVADKAREVLQPLADMHDGHALTYFSNGLLHLMNDRFTSARDALLQGIARNTENPALNADMQKIIDELDKLPTESPSGNNGTPAVDASDDEKARHIFLSAYTGSETRQ